MDHSNTDKELRKAAILLVSISDRSASKILELLDPPTLKKISAEIQSLGEIRQEDRNQAVADFLDEILDQNFRKCATTIRRWSNSNIPINFPRFIIDN